MYPPPQGFNLDIEAISGILGSVSIACWVVVFSPQIIENFRRGSADGLSVVFLVIWLAGDVFNILGAVIQGVLPTMIILAIYYTLADIVLLCQCFYYEGFTLSWNPKIKDGERNERSPLLDQPDDQSGSNTLVDGEAHGSYGATHLRDHLLAVDATHLSPVTPLLQEEAERPPPSAPTSVARAVLFNSLAIVLVCSAGVVGWLLGNSGPPMEEKPTQPEHQIAFSPLGQVFGYICAALYLGSRIPQLLLNYRRKSTEGISMLFFVFACIGNLTYVLSIVAYGPVCDRPKHCREGEAAGQYKRYIAVNLSWILGSLGTLLLDLGVFVQYFLYKDDQSEDSDRDDTDEGGFVTEPAVVSRNASQRREVVFETEGWN